MKLLVKDFSIMIMIWVIWKYLCRNWWRNIKHYLWPTTIDMTYFHNYKSKHLQPAGVKKCESFRPITVTWACTGGKVCYWQMWYFELDKNCLRRLDPGNKLMNAMMFKLYSCITINLNVHVTYICLKPRKIFRSYSLIWKMMVSNCMGSCLVL